ncbi:hypothetical protein AGR4C_pa50020 [Agrobacterium tumefaciens str. Kerr 14]|uniref:VirA/G regulated protein n=1 Tax=Agrobacterium tumefaciens str. Kerr 14 TaxID=1183424 RepID=A0A1S7SB10_AGRTU|nr:hypothetical protein [Agrobacterium tumefaciens]CUX65428.1 hypothetical protein AGR4C_pa50020 [Agrobacterium tumefaciens str. Kerr 14]
MAQSLKKLSRNTDSAFARTAKREQRHYDALANEKNAKAKDFEKKYGQRGKAREYADELADIGKLSPEARKGTLYQSWLKQKKLFVDPDEPGALVREKRRLNGKTQKFERQIPLSDAEKAAGNTPRAMIARVLKTRGGKTIDRKYDEDGKLTSSLKLRSGGRFEDRWETDSNGRLIQTRFRTDRLRDGIFFSPVSKRMSGLDENGKRLLVQTKGSRKKIFERDEETGELTLTGKKGLFGSKYLNSDGSLARISRKFGKLWQKDIEYIGDNAKRVTTTFLGRKSIRTVPLKENEDAEQQRRKDAAQADRTDPAISPGGSVAAHSETVSAASDRHAEIATPPSRDDQSASVARQFQPEPPLEKVGDPFEQNVGFGPAFAEPDFSETRPENQSQVKAGADEDEAALAALLESANMGQQPPESVERPTSVLARQPQPEPPMAPGASRFARPSDFAPAFSESAGPVRRLGSRNLPAGRSDPDGAALAALLESANMGRLQPENEEWATSALPRQPQPEPPKTPGASRFAKPSNFVPAFPEPAGSVDRSGRSRNQAHPQVDADALAVLLQSVEMDKNQSGLKAPPTVSAGHPRPVPAVATGGSRFATQSGRQSEYPVAVSTDDRRSFVGRDRSIGIAR